MKRELVESSSIKSIGSEIWTAIEVEFKSGDVYLYLCPDDIFKKIKESPSIGSAVNKLLVKAGYPCYKLVVPKPKVKK